MRAPILSISASALVTVSALVACGGGNANAPSVGVNGTGQAPPAEIADAGVSSLDIDAGAPSTVAPLPGAASGGDKLPNVGATRGPEPGRSKEDILALVKTRKSQARACYDAAVKDHPGIEGQIVIRWTIDPKGNVTEVALDSNSSAIVEPAVSSCLIGLVKSFHFPESVRGLETHASYPWTFHPRGTPAESGNP